jgi:outer membrane receptor for ferrienterochelin and colicins
MDETANYVGSLRGKIMNALKKSALYMGSVAVLASAFPTSVFAADDVIDEQDIIVVTATRTALRLVDAPASLSVVTSTDIELTASVNVLDAVRQTPGISFQGRGFGGRQALSIRGMGRDQTLFMIDGRRILGTDNVFTHSNFQYDWIPLGAVEHIEVVRGPLSALYGSDALGGVVNIVTKKALDTWNGSASARYTVAEDEGDEQFVGLYASGPLGDKAGVILSYTYNNAEEIPFAADPAISELEGKEAHNVYGRISYQPTDKHEFNIDLSIGKEDRFRNLRNRNRPPVFESSFDLDRLQYGAGYTGEYGDVTAHVNLNHAELERVNFRTENIPPSVPQVFKNDMIDGHVVVPAGDAHRLVVGGEYRRETLVHSSFAKGEGSLDYTSVFAQDEWRISDDLLLTVGARYDDHENFGSEISPRAYLVYHVGDSWTLKGGYGHGFKSPTLKESSPDYRFVGPFTFVGNADVGPETSDNFELSTSYETQNFRLVVTGFINQVDDLISTICTENCTARFGRVFSFINLERTETKGIETELEFDLSRSVSLSASHVYMKSKDKATGLRLAERPKHVVGARLNWQIQNPGITLAVRASYHGSEIEFGRTGNVIKLPGYTLWHAQGSWDIRDDLQMTFGVKNLTNVSLAEKSTTFSFAERGRSFYLGVRKNF